MIENKHDRWFARSMQRICVFFSIPILIMVIYALFSTPQELRNGVYPHFMQLEVSYTTLQEDMDNAKIKIKEQDESIEILRSMINQKGIVNASTFKGQNFSRDYSR